MAEMHGHITPDQARTRLRELRDKEKRGELTVKDAGEITHMLVVLGEAEMERHEKAA